MNLRSTAWRVHRHTGPFVAAAVARVVGKGGAVGYVHWQTGTALLLAGRERGAAVSRRPAADPGRAGRGSLPGHRPCPAVVPARCRAVRRPHPPPGPPCPGGRLPGLGWRLPALSLAAFRSVATGLQNYVAGPVDLALNATGDEDARFADRNVRHLITHLPSRATFEQVLDAV